MMFSDGVGAFFEAGGWGMYPTLLFGFYLLVRCTLFALRPQAERMGGLWIGAGLVLGSGVLGTLAGLIATTKSMQHVAPEDRLIVLGMGASESANVMVLALMLFIVALLIAEVGAWRLARTT